MTNEKLVQSPECEDMYEEMYEDVCDKMYKDMYEDHVCPRCSSLLHHDYVISIETGLIELVWLCYYCGHTE